ncbi:MAG: CoA transferase [Pseudomonadales bacterium]|nr:CoA transferase [Pseudomonadales bacterium]
MSVLAGVRVIELASERVAFAGKLLADMGADVILVEPPAGDAARHYPPFVDDVPGPERSLHFWHYNTSKRGVTLDLSDSADQARLRRLLADADVFLESQPTTRLAALGLDYTDLASANPGLVHVAVTPYGRQRPESDLPETDLTLMAAGGPVWSCGYDDHSLPPVRGWGFQAYHTACHYVVMSVFTALLYRQRGGGGQFIDVSVAAACNVTTEGASYGWLVAEATLQRQTGRHASVTPTGETQMRCADGRWVNTGVPPRFPEEFARLLAWIRKLDLEASFPEAVFLEMGADWEGPFDLSLIGSDDTVTAIFGAGREGLKLVAQRVSAQEFFEGCQHAGLAVGVINSPEEALEDPHFRARGMQVPVHHEALDRTIMYPGAPFSLPLAPWRIARRAPYLGEHNAELFGDD